MTPKQFIEKMIEGGWIEGENWKFVTANSYWVVWLNGNGDETTINFNEYLMNPLAWKAVGKTMEKWNDIEAQRQDYWEPYESGHEWHMHRMIDALCEGKSITEFLETL